MSGKILITGKGLLGKFLKEYFNAEFLDVDITKYKDTPKWDILIHTAAWTNVEECEINIDKAYKTNTIGSYNLIKNFKGKFIYISSTGIYGNYKKDEYTEFDEVKPTTIHHKSKYEGEKIVRDLSNDFLILRTGWLYGNKNDFVTNRIKEAKNKIVYSDPTQVGNPTYILDLAKQIEVLFDEKGIFNCVNNGSMSRFEYVKTIYEYFNLEIELIKKEYKRVAPVSKNESARNYKLELLGKNMMRDSKEALKDYLDGINLNELL